MSPPSALIGQPPLTDDDYWIVRGMLLVAGLENVDPHEGAKLPPARPPPDVYHFETRGPAILAGCAVSIALMLLFTGTRLVVRCTERSLHFGRDDWFIIPACVGSVIRALEKVADDVNSFLPCRGQYSRLPLFIWEARESTYTTLHITNSICFIGYSIL